MTPATPTRSSPPGSPSPVSTPDARNATELFGNYSPFSGTSRSHGNGLSSELKTFPTSTMEIELPGDEAQLSSQIAEAFHFLVSEEPQQAFKAFCTIFQSLAVENSNPSRIIGRAICTREIGNICQMDPLLKNLLITQAQKDLERAYKLISKKPDNELKNTLLCFLKNQYEQIKPYIDITLCPDPEPYSANSTQDMIERCQEDIDSLTKTRPRISRLTIFKIFTSSVGVLLLVYSLTKVLQRYRVKKLS